MTPHPDLARRQFLRLLAYGGAAGGLAACTSGRQWTDATEDPTLTDATSASPISSVPTAELDRRRLVVIELSGGNDGLDTVVPYADPAYLRHRPDIGLDLGAVRVIDDEIGLNPALEKMHGRGLAIVQGVGTPDPDLSHFESMRRWWEGDEAGREPMTTGFLGRLCDQLDVGAPVTGLAVSWAPSPALLSEKAVTLSLPDPNGAWWVTEQDEWAQSLKRGLHGLARAEDDSAELAGLTRSNLGKALAFAEVIAELPEPSEVYPGGELSDQLALAARVLDADVGVRVVNLAWGDFDTHGEHRYMHDDLMGQLDVAVDAFLTDIEARGLADQVLIATTSEFGRRVPQNDDGTDHGAASHALLAGPIEAGRYGEYPSLSRLDEEDNLQMTVGMGEYYATLAEGWFGIPAGDVLSGSPTPLLSI